MARLEWRDVRAPDFGDAFQGLRDFATTFGGTVDRAKQGVAEYDKDVSTQINNAIMQSLLTEQDPVALRDKLASGSYLQRVDPRRLNATTLSAIAARPGQLLEQTKGFRENAHAEADDKAAPIIAKMAQAIAAGDTKGFDALHTANPKLFEGMSSKQVLDYTNQFQGLEKGNVDITGARQDQKMCPT